MPALDVVGSLLAAVRLRVRIGSVRLAAVPVLVAAFAVALSLLAPASASALPEIEKTHMSEIVEWVYRNAGLEEDPHTCKEVCAAMWTAEHQELPALPAVQNYWNQLGQLETEGTGLWGTLAKFSSELTNVPLGPAQLKVGWHIGGNGAGTKWMEIEAPQPPARFVCEVPYVRLLVTGERVGSTFFEEAHSPGNEWYLNGQCTGLGENIGQETKPENPSAPESNCGDNGAIIPGWKEQRWQWNRCFEGYYEGHEVLAPVYAQAFYQQFNFSPVEDWSHQHIEGEDTHNIETTNQSDPGEVAVKSATEGSLEIDPYLREWIQWVLEGQHGLDPLFVSPGEEYGLGGGSTPNKPKCPTGHPVNCATGNQVETQTDLSVGGRGPGLHLTRTYNSQLAATQTSPGPFGYGWTGSYSAHIEVNEAQGVATVYQDDGSALRFWSDNGGWVPVGPLVQATLAKEGTGWVYTLPNQTVLHFSSSGLLTSEVDRNGNTVTVNHTTEGRLESVADASGRKITFKYNSEGLVESAKDPMGHEVKYTYESKNLKSVTEPGETAANWQFKYDTLHELTEEINGRGYAVKSEYDSSHRVITQTDALERKRTLKYATVGGDEETTITEPSGSETVEKFNGAGLPVSVTHAAGTAIASTTTDGYDIYGDLVAVTDPNGHTTRFSYDAAGDRTSETDPLGHITQWVYDGTHDVIEVALPDGEITTITRNSHGDAETVSRPAPGNTIQTTKYKYDSHGDLESVTDPLEHTTTYEYNTHGDRAAETDPEGNKRTWEYNEDSQETATISPRGNVSGGEPTKFKTSTERDKQGRPIKITDPLAHTTKYTYDAAGNLETVTDGNAHKTKYTYDADNEQTKVEEPNATILETGYDKAGQITSQTDGLTHTTKYVRNALEEITEVINPKERKTVKEYDKAGNLTTVKDAAGRTTTLTYDPANRLTEVSYSDGHTHTAKYEYNGDGELTHMTDGTGESTYTYDQLDRLTESKNGHGETTSYTYNLANEPTKITYPNGKAVTRAYDKDERLESVEDWLEHTTKFAYDPDSNLAKTTFPSGTSDEDTYAFNDADQPSEVKMLKGTETLASLAYTPDSDGQTKKTVQKSLPGAETTEDTYDSDNRLTKSGSTIYEYNKADSPTKIGTGSYTYSSASELETGPSVTYTYNEVGERTKSTPTSGTATTYGYDQAGNLISVEKSPLDDTYTYNGEDLRASQTISGTTTYLAWDVAEGIPLLLSDGTNSYVYGPEGLPIEQINNSTSAVLYMHHDQQGSTRLLTGSTGAKEASFTYDAYGNTTGTTGTATTPLGYDAQYTSSDTGLIYLRARTYDPKTAQFLGVDPLSEVTRAPYNYTGDDPLTFGDPTGLLAIPIVGGAGADAACGVTIEVPVLDGVTCGAAALGGAAAGAAAGVTLAESYFGEEAGDEGEQALKENEAANEKDCGKLPEVDGTGRAHGDIPGFPPSNWTDEDLEQAAEDLRNSIPRRVEKMDELGEDTDHRRRISEEEQLLRQIEKKLSGS